MANAEKKQKISLDLMKCIICQEDDKKRKIVQTKSKDSLNKLFSAVRTRFQCLDHEIDHCYYRMVGLEESSLEQCIYHSECYKKITNSTNLERLLQRAKNNIFTDNVDIEMTEGVKTPSIDDEPKISLRSKHKPYDKKSCIICQSKDGKLHKVETRNVGERMLQVAKELPDQSFYIRMNSIPNPSDAVANDVCYHQKCWVSAQRTVNKNDTSIQNIDDLDRILADIEIVELVKKNCSNSENESCDMDMNNLNKTYNNLLGNETEKNYKKYLKTLLKDNIDDLTFSRPPSRRLSEKLFSLSFQERAVDAFSSCSDDYFAMFEVAKMIRNDVLNYRNWKFSGDFSKFEIPNSLQVLLRWILIGPKENIDIGLKKKSKIDSDVSNISQIIMKTTKSKRQISQPGRTGCFRDMVETPLSVGLGLHIHKETRSKKIISCLSELGITISYERIMKIENGLGNALLDEISSNSSFVPATLQRNKCLHFAIDNIDFNNDTADGKFEFHGTTLVAFQKQSNDHDTTPIQFTQSEKFNFQNTHYFVKETFPKPNAPNEAFPSFQQPMNIDNAVRADRTWGMLKVVEDESISSLPTWNAFNSQITKSSEVTTCQGFPLYPGSPTDWSNLYTTLKLAQGISVAVCGQGKTIITLDLQLYSKCMQMRENESIKNDFIFRLGELHIVFAFLKVMGKYIAGSGVDQVLIEADVYGPTTLGQILQGKHLKRGMDAHMILYLALFKIYIENVSEKNPEVREIIADKSHFLKSEGVIISSELFNKTIDELTDTGIFQIFNDFDKVLQQGALFLRNYMKMCEVLLNFVRANREENWQLHLTSLNSMIPYFFAHDQINYARHAPLYLATMLELEHNEPQIWEYLKNSFSVNKTGIPFCSIGTDHALEQENKVMKVSGGVKGLTQDPLALYRFCLIAPFLNNISKAFCDNHNISKSTREKHYQLSDATNARLCKNVQRVLEKFRSFEVDFKNCDYVENIVSKAVLSDKNASELLRHESIGKDLYELFVKNRLVGEESVWSPLKKTNLATFQCQAKKLKTKVGEKVVSLKEEHNLLSRLLIAARKRPEIDLEKSIGEFEFSVVPKSMFTQDGQPLPSSDKSKVLHAIEDMANESGESVNIVTSPVIIIDGMALVNKTQISENVKTWRDFAEAFVSMVKKVSRNCSELRLVFDRYIKESLKARTRAKRSLGVDAVKYNVTANSNISNKSLKHLLAHIDTKQSLTEYLSKHTIDALKGNMNIAITYSTKTESNIENFSRPLLTHDHEEADTLMLMHAIDVANKNLESHCIVLSPDTDVLLLLIHFNKRLPSTTLFRTGNADKERDILVRACSSALGVKRSEAILGFHSLTGSDQTGRFSGKSKITWWQEFLSADDKILAALSSLGDGYQLPKDSTILSIERFITNAYATRESKRKPITLAQLRWFLFSKFQYDAAKLPPTLSALKFKIFRCHYMCIVYKRSNLPIQSLPSPENYGWELQGQSLNPVLTDKLPAPIGIIELSACNCKSGCKNKRCKCLKNDFACTDMCKCTKCENDGSGVINEDYFGGDVDDELTI